MSSKTKARRVALFFICKSFVVWLNRKHSIFLIENIQHSVSAFNLFVLFWLKYMKLVLHWYLIWKGRSSLAVFSCCYRYFSLILHQNSTSENFSKMRCNVTSDTLSVNCPHSVTSKSLAELVCWRNLLPRHDFVTPCTHHLENFGSMNYTSLPNDNISHYMTLLKKKNTFINIAIYLIRKVLCIDKVFKFSGRCNF